MFLFKRISTVSGCKRERERALQTKRNTNDNLTCVNNMHWLFSFVRLINVIDVVVFTRWKNSNNVLSTCESIPFIIFTLSMSTIFTCFFSTFKTYLFCRFLIFVYTTITYVTNTLHYLQCCKSAFRQHHSRNCNNGLKALDF